MSSKLFIILLVKLIVSIAANQVPYASEARRELVRNADNRKMCFDLNYNQGYADYILDPFKANDDRGDWGKCMNGQLFGAMCIHDEMHAINNNQWAQGEGPLHDEFAESMFLKLKKLHNDYCLHVDVKFTPVMKQKLNDHLFARNVYSMEAKNDTTNTFTFETLIDSNGKYYINGNTLPTLQLFKGNTYYFTMRNEDYTKYPLTFGVSVGTTVGLVTATKTYDVTKVTLALPFDAPDSIVYYALNGATASGTANLMEPSSFNLGVRGGAYYVNSIASATLLLQRGVKYSFVLLNADQTLYPFMIGTSYGIPYLGGSISVQMGTYYTTFFVTVTDPSITSLVYYCVNNPAMVGVINIRDSASLFSLFRVSSPRSLVMQDDDGFDLPFDKTCSGDFKVGNPRAALKMSLYCAVARMESQIPVSIQSKPYVISSSCDQIVRSFLTTQLYSAKNPSPYQFCSQQTVPIDGVDTCTVQAPVSTFVNRTCADYCEGFDGLTCSAASVRENGVYCQSGRAWSCNTPQQNEWTLICTCTPKTSTFIANNYSPSSSPSVAPTDLLVAASFKVAKSVNNGSPSPSVVPTSGLIISSFKAAAATVVKAVNGDSSSPSVVPTRGLTNTPLKAAATTKSTSAPTTGYPLTRPTLKPSLNPTTRPTRYPTNRPSLKPSSNPTVTPTRNPSNRPSLKPSLNPTTTPTRKPTASPSLKPSPNPTIRPTNYPISIYQQNTYIASSCLTLMQASVYQAKSVCQQDLIQDSCSVLAPMSGFSPTGSCTKYCKANGLRCLSAFDGWSCARSTQRSCDYERTDSSLCECGQPIADVSPSISPSSTPTGNSVQPSVQNSNFPLVGSYYFIGCYTDQSNRAMATSPGRKTITDCADYATKNKYQFFGLQNYRTTTLDGECWLSNDISSSTKYGATSFGGSYATCVFDSTGVYKYGLSWTNAIYTTNTFSPAVPTKAPSTPDELNTKTCATMVFYHSGPYSPGSKLCPRYTVTPLDVDSCTAQPYNSAVTCSQYCSSFPGLTCLDAAAASGDTCNIDQKYGKIGCDAVGVSYKLCTCGISPPAMAVFEAKKNESISNACLNLMFQPQPLYKDRRQICSSSVSDNSCLVTVSNSYTCSHYCSSYSGMTCMNAYVPSSYRSCFADKTQSITCTSNITVTDSILCRCGFASGAPQASSLKVSLFDSNLAYCPAYPTGTFTNDSILSSSNYRRKLDDFDDKKKYGRSYKKITLTVDYNAEKADGSAHIIGAETRWDNQDWSTDTYSTATPEMCTGLESRIRKGDPASKCSFGNRPGGDPSENCYGKLYSMNFKEASSKCAARGGNLARIDSAKEFATVTSMFQNDRELSVGLYDKSGGDWRWDGFSDAVPSNWFNTTIRFKTRSWVDDCSKIVFNNANNQRSPYLSTAACSEKRTYLCEGKSTKVGNTTIGGDLLADEGGFCIWYYQNPKISLPDDESANFRNTELAYFNMYDPNQNSRKYILIRDKLYSADNIPGTLANKANFNALTGRKFGKNSDEPIIPANEHNSSFHCHFSPTNFGMYRIYHVQHMLQRLYTGSANEHCFCGYKNIGHLFDRCDCTRSGEQDNQCLTETSKILYEDTYAETGEYVRCNNCNNPSP